MLPLVSVSRHWSTRSPTSSPATALPATRCDSISFRARERPNATVSPPGTKDLAARALVVGARADQPVVVVLLEEIGGPARDAGGRDDRREEVDRDADRVEERRRVEVHVGDERLGRADLRVELHREVVPERRSGLAARRLGHALQDGRARVARRVDAVAHAHEPALRGECLVHEAVHVVELADLEQRVHDGLAGAAVERALERADAARHGRVHVGQGRRDHARREGRGVQLVLGVEDEARVEGLGRDLARLLARSACRGSSRRARDPSRAGTGSWPLRTR